jgi:hypothetical protein
MDKGLTEVEVYEEDKDLTTYVGRVLGLVTPEEFNALIRNKNLQRKILSAATVKCSEIADIEEDLIRDMRLVVDVKKKDENKNLPRTVLVSSPIDFINNIDMGSTVGSTNISINCEDGTYVLISEKRGKQINE